MIFYDHFGPSKFSFHSLPVPGNDSLHFPFPNSGIEFFHSLPVPEFREWIFLFHSCAQILGRLFFSFCIFHSPIMHSRSPLEWLVLLTLFSPSRPPLFPKMLRKTGKEQRQVSLSIFFVVISPRQMSKEETFNHQQCEMWNLPNLFTKYVGAGLTCNFQTRGSGPRNICIWFWTPSFSAEPFSLLETKISSSDLWDGSEGNIEE